MVTDSAKYYVAWAACYVPCFAAGLGTVLEPYSATWLEGYATSSGASWCEASFADGLVSHFGSVPPRFLLTQVAMVAVPEAYGLEEEPGHHRFPHLLLKPASSVGPDLDRAGE